MVFFITVLRALAACLITNAHYEGVYPTDIIANGGLLGDVIFFAVSGYCLTNIKNNFPKWYGRRLLRCYLPVVLITTVYFLLGLYDFSYHGFVWWFIYPTNYHFIASIVLLYIPYYFIMRTERLRENIPLIMGIVALMCLVVYMLFYDRCYYHIDTVREPMIEFLYIESMLMGAWFKKKDGKYRNKKNWLYPIGLFISFICYFASKLFFSRGVLQSQYQIINWVTLFVLLYFTLRTFSSIDSKLEAMPKCLKQVISFVAIITLEIYVVQYALIDLLKPLFNFPVNWLVLTGSILVAAFILHMVCNWILGLPEKMRKIGNKQE